MLIRTTKFFAIVRGAWIHKKEIGMKGIQKNWKLKAIALLLAAAIPVVIYLIVFGARGVLFGDKTVLTSDLNGQYVNYFIYFRNAILNGDNLTYTFSKILGGDTWSMIGYYMMSPLNFIALLYPAADMASAIYMIILAKISLMGVTSYLFFTHKRGFAWSHLIFSVSYALMGYGFAYFMHVMWFDGLYLLPIVAIALERMIEKKKSLCYIISLALTFINCYYIGYMVAGFSLLYGLFLIFSVKRSVKESLGKCVRFLLSSVCAVGVSAVVLLPTIFSQMGSHSDSSTIVGIKHTLFAFMSKFFTGVYSAEDFANGLPQIYVGILIVVLVLLYFVGKPQGMSDEEKNAWRRKKIAAAVLLIAMVASFMFGVLDIIWHIFSNPNSFNHRYAFIFSFFLIVFAEESFEKVLRGSREYSVLLSGGILILLAVFVLLQNYDLVDRTWLILDIGAIIGVVVLLLLYKKEKKIVQCLCICALGIIQIAQLSMNGADFSKVYTFDDNSVKGYYESMTPFVEKIKAKDTDFYRIEKTFHNSTNDPMMLSYHGLSHFSSSEKNGVKNFVAKLGYTKNHEFWAYYANGASIAADSLLGVKYLISQQGETNLNLIEKVKGKSVYENPYALGIGTVCSDKIQNVTLDMYAPFASQEQMYAHMTGDSSELFSAYPYELGTSNLKGTVEESELTQTVYTKEDGGQDAFVSISFEAADESPVYMYLPSLARPGVSLSVNGSEPREYLSTNSSGIVPLGCFEPGQKVEVTMNLVAQYVMFATPQIYKLNMDVLKEKTLSLQKNSWNVTKFDNNHIEADVKADGEGDTLLLSIPYDKNWKIFMDGKAVEAKKVFGALMSVDLENGSHHLVMRYEVQGLLPGMYITILSLLACIVSIMIGKIRKKHVSVATIEGKGNE